MKMIKSIYDSDVRYDAINDNITREGNDNDDTVARLNITVVKTKNKRVPWTIRNPTIKITQLNPKKQ